MALFGKKDNKDSDENQVELNDIDAKIMAAIEETEKEEALLKEQKRQAETDRIEAQTREREEALKKAKALEELKAKLPNEGRRFYLFAEEASLKDRITEVTGNIYGEIHKEDKVFAYRPDGRVLPAAVRYFKMSDKVEPQGVKNAHAVVGLKFDREEDTDSLVPKFTVITGIGPRDLQDRPAPVENPALTGLSLRFKDFKDDKEYMRILLSRIVAARFVLPVHASGEIGADGKKTMKVVTVNNPREEGKQMLPVFTDLAALSAWKTVFDEEHKPSVIVMNFNDAVKFSQKDSFDITINPMGPVAIHLPRTLIENIVSSESYKRIVDNNSRKADPQYVKKTVKDASKVAVGEPPRNEETAAVRQALKDYCSENPSVLSFGLLMKLQDGKRGYLVIADCPTALEKEIFTGMYKAVKPHLNHVKAIDFSLYTQTVFADRYFAKIPFDYVKNPNEE